MEKHEFGEELSNVLSIKNIEKLFNMEIKKDTCKRPSGQTETVYNVYYNGKLKFCHISAQTVESIFTFYGASLARRLCKAAKHDKKNNKEVEKILQQRKLQKAEEEAFRKTLPPS